MEKPNRARQTVAPVSHRMPLRNARLTQSQVAKIDNKLFLPTRDKESQRQSPKALELSDDPCIHVGDVLLCPSKGGWAGATGGHFQPILTWPDCQRNNYATIKYAILAIPGPQWLEVQVPTWVRRVREVLVRRTQGRFLGWQTWSNSQ